MSYLVLARKYRPQSFDDMVGQEHVARTLANAIAMDRIAHAFLFTGVRGVGKTTSARLLAKALNCVGKDGKQTKATSTPCQVCAPCVEITAGSDLDVQEIDGASYNGIDEVRRLQEGLAFRPARDRSKIFIVDEVHMLSNAAWNAFLKTLEEPPPHVKFIFATTEAHKVPITILSRCQRYDFKLISAQTIAGRLRFVLEGEKIKADDEAIGILAREAAGSMRDAMSFLDQAIAYSGRDLKGIDVARVLGVADRAILHGLALAILEGDAARVLHVIDQVAEQGYDIAHVTKDALLHFRNLVVAKVCGASGKELLDLADEEVNDLLSLAEKTHVDDLLRLFHGFSKGYDEIARSQYPRTALEMTLVRLSRRPPLLALDELLNRLGDLERRLAGNLPPSKPTKPSGNSGGVGRTNISSSMTHGSGSVTDTPIFGALALVETPRMNPVAAAKSMHAVQEVAATEGTGALVASSTHAPAPSPDMVAWRAIVERVRTHHPAVASIFEHALVLEMGVSEIGEASLRIGYRDCDTFLKEQANDPEALDLLTREARAHFGTSLAVSLDLSAQKSSAQATLYSINEDARAKDLEGARERVRKHPLVQEVIRLFGAEIREIRTPKG